MKIPTNSRSIHEYTFGHPSICLFTLKWLLFQILSYFGYFLLKSSEVARQGPMGEGLLMPLGSLSSSTLPLITVERSANKQNIDIDIFPISFAQCIALNLSWI